MTEKFLPLEANTARKPFFSRWKWVGLGVFVLVLIFGRWLNGLLVFLGWAYGLVVVANLAFRSFIYLKNRFFWRVRNRILGSFVFVGFLPLLLLVGVAFLASWVLLGQLAANYLESSLTGVVGEITSIDMGLAQDISRDGPGGFEAAAKRLMQEHVRQFPKIMARLSRKLPGGAFEVVSVFDPHRIASGPGPGKASGKKDDYPAARWLGPSASFDGFLRLDRTVLLTSVHGVPGLGDYIVEVTAPLDQGIEQRLERERSLYAIFDGTGRSRATTNRRGLQIEIDGDNAHEQVFQSRSESLDARRARDPRRMVWWWTLLDARNYWTGEKDLAAYSLFYVPLKVLYANYFTGRYNQGEVLLRVIYALVGLFVLVEIISVIVGVTISRRITRSVHEMYRGTLALQGGNLQHQIPVRRNDQLGMLAHSFNQMTGSITRLLEEVTEKKRLEQELEIAREVQATLFPKQLPHAPGLDVFGGCEPARVVSGDYYDFIIEDEAHLHVVVGDISGKGISAALLMANLQAAMRNQVLLFKGVVDIPETLAEMMRRLNQQIFMNSPSEKYATVFAGRYDAEARVLHYCNAGHLPPVLLDNGQLKRLETGGMVLGLFESARFQAGTVELNPGAMLAIFTDGVTEAFNIADEEFGEDRLIETLVQCRNNGPEEIYRMVTARVRDWQGALKQHDDITLIVAKVV